MDEHRQELAAWREARAAFPFFRFHWAVKGVAGRWDFPYGDAEDQA